MKNLKADKVVRSQRKTISLEVNSKSELILRVPSRVSLQRINEVISTKKNWILKKKKFAARRLAKEKKIFFIEGTKIPFLGENYFLKFTSQKKIKLSAAHLEFPFSALQKKPRIFLEKWYRLQAKKIITARCAFYQRKTGLNCRAIKISSAQKRFGSCGPKNSLNFNWRLVLAPLFVVDYVIVHELAHCEIKNHSADFWKIVRAFFPAWREAKKWLKNNYFQLYTLG